MQRRSDNGQWGLVGGSMEIGETMEEAARREALEETGLTLGELEWLGLFSGPEQIFHYPNGDVVAYVAAAYVARQYTGALRANEKSLELHFFDLASLPQDICPLY